MPPIYRLAAATWLLASLAVGAAPRSKAATGAIAAQVEAALAGGSKTFDHSAWSALLAAAVDERGSVDYRALQDRRADLDYYLGAVAAVKLSTLRAAELEALLINAYNALTIASILAHPGVETIQSIDGVWDGTRHRVGRFELTLDDIEHTLLRPYFRDPRIHFAVNCASASCAPLPRWAFDGAKLDRQLDQRARLFLSDPRNVKIDGSTLYLSRYFDWYGDDFTAEGWKPRAASLAEFVALYSTPEVAARLRFGGELEIEFLDYDWALNASVPPRAR